MVTEFITKYRHILKYLYPQPSVETQLSMAYNNLQPWLRGRRRHSLMQSTRSQWWRLYRRRGRYPKGSRVEGERSPVPVESQAERVRSPAKGKTPVDEALNALNAWGMGILDASVRRGNGRVAARDRAQHIRRQIRDQARRRSRKGRVHRA